MAEPDDTLPQEAPVPPSIPGKCVELRLATVGAVTHVYALVELADGSTEWRYQARPALSLENFGNTHPVDDVLGGLAEAFVGAGGEWVKRSPHA